MATELWEIVRAKDIKAGDCIASEPLCVGIQRKDVFSVESSLKMRQFDVGEEAWIECEDNEEIFRRYAGPSPEVLMRALENLAWKLCADRKTVAGWDAFLDAAIKQAEADINAEAKETTNGD